MPVQDEPDHDEETIVTPSAGSNSSYPSSEPGSAYEPRGYVPPGTPPDQTARRKAWPWVLGIIVLLLLALAGLGIAAATFIPSILRASNENAANSNSNVFQPNLNENLNGNSANSENENNSNSNAEETAPPTSEPEVLVTLTDLEHEWTVANINADKKKLNRILADDYVGKTPEGKTQGKADYLRTIERDTVTQRWEFEELKVNLLGDSATLTGVLRMELRNQRGEEVTVAYSFTDKFVWRDNRWQAVSSEVKQEE